MAEQEEERIMIVPLRAAWAASRTDRTPRAIKAIREHVKQHLKPDRIFIDDVLNEYLWKRGREHPPRRIRIKAIKFEDGSAVVSPGGLRDPIASAPRDRREPLRGGFLRG